MKIAVCIKQVPAKDAPLHITENGTWIRETDIGFEMNEPDSFALEEVAIVSHQDLGRPRPRARKLPSRRRTERRHSTNRIGTSFGTT